MNETQNYDHIQNQKSGPATDYSEVNEHPDTWLKSNHKTEGHQKRNIQGKKNEKVQIIIITKITLYIAFKRDKIMTYFLYS